MAEMRQRSTVNGMPLRRALAGATAAALVLVLAGCQEAVTGIFHHLAHQQPTVDRNLANHITIGGVARWDDRYLVAAGKLWSRTVGTDTRAPGEWASMAVTFDGRSRSAVMQSLVRWRPDAGSPSLLAEALFVDEERFALVRADGSRITANSVAWETVPIECEEREETGCEVIGLFAPDRDESVLFGVIAQSREEPRTYQLLSATRRSAEAPVFRVELDGLSHPVAAVATDGDGTYWAVSGGDLYAGRLGGLQKPDTAPSPEGSETFRGVIHDGMSTLVLTGRHGDGVALPGRGRDLARHGRDQGGGPGRAPVGRDRRGRHGAHRHRRPWLLHGIPGRRPRGGAAGAHHRGDLPRIDPATLGRPR